VAVASGSNSRTLVGLGALLFLLGLLTGVVVPALRSPRIGLSAHLEGVMNGTFLMVLGAIWHHVHLSPPLSRLCFWLSVSPNLSEQSSATLVQSGRPVAERRAVGRRTTMWKSQIDTVRQGCVRIRIAVGERSLCYAETLELWAGEGGFRDWFSHVLLNAPFDAYCWECPPLVRSSIDREFEFVLIDVPALHHLRADPQPFAEQFSRCEPGVGVVAFSNLGGDALLIAPLPIDVAAVYSHLASFLRSAPRSQCHALWQAVGNAIKERLSEDPIWVSTAGLGVPWLHVRLDSRPKYYRFDAYRSAA